MGPQHQQLVLFAVLSGLCSSAFGQEAPATMPCLTSRENCSIATSVSVINNNYFCCEVGYSMSMTNTACTCTRTSEVRDCGKGPRACARATSFSSDGSGNTLCCPPGFSMTSFAGFFNNQYKATCKCSRSLGGAGNVGSSVFVGNGGIVIGGAPGGFNVTEFERNMRTWGQNFAAQMATMSANLQRNLGNMFRNLGIFG